VKRAFRGPKNYKRSDERIHEDVSDRLAHQDDVDPSDIEVAVSSGEVTLTGTVQTRREKFLAEEIADDVGGVTEVHNLLRVRREGAQLSPTAQSAGTTTNNGEGRSRNTPRA
jgi:osmotically-inducible protein OsmY